MVVEECIDRGDPGVLTITHESLNQQLPAVVYDPFPRWTLIERRRRDVLTDLGAVLTGLIAGCQSSSPSTDVQNTRTSGADRTQAPTVTGSGSAAAKSVDTPALRQRTKSLVRALAAERYQAVYERTTGQLAEQISPSRLEQVWTRQAEPLGAFTNVGAVEFRGERQGVHLLRTQAIFGE